MLFGLLLLYVGERNLRKKSVNRNISLIIIISGAVAMLYHGHIMTLHTGKKK